MEFNAAGQHLSAARVQLEFVAFGENP